MQNYIVKKGDTLSKIRKNLNLGWLSLERIKSLNPQVKDINVIQPGWNLKLPKGFVEMKAIAKIEKKPVKEISEGFGKIVKSPELKASETKAKKLFEVKYPTKEVKQSSVSSSLKKKAANILRLTPEKITLKETLPFLPDAIKATIKERLWMPRSLRDFFTKHFPDKETRIKKYVAKGWTENEAKTKVMGEDLTSMVVAGGISPLGGKMSPIFRRMDKFPVKKMTLNQARSLANNLIKDGYRNIITYARGSKSMVNFADDYYRILKNAFPENAKFLLGSELSTLNKLTGNFVKWVKTFKL